MNDAGGYNFWRGSSPEIARINRITDRAEFEAASLHFEMDVWPAISRRIERAGASPMERSNAWYGLAGEDFFREPGPFLSRLLQNGWLFWRPWLNPATSPLVVVLLSGMLGSTLYVASVFGGVVLYRSNRGAAVWIAVYVLTFWIVQIPFQVVSRFRIPVVDPICILLAAGCLVATPEPMVLHRLLKIIASRPKI